MEFLRNHFSPLTGTLSSSSVMPEVATLNREVGFLLTGNTNSVDGEHMNNQRCTTPKPSNTGGVDFQLQNSWVILAPTVSRFVCLCLLASPLLFISLAVSAQESTTQQNK